MEEQVRIVRVGTRQFLQTGNRMVPVYGIERILFEPESIINDSPTPRIQIDCHGDYKFVAIGDEAVKAWEWLAP